MQCNKNLQLHGKEHNTYNRTSKSADVRIQPQLFDFKNLPYPKFLSLNSPDGPYWDSSNSWQNPFPLLLYNRLHFRDNYANYCDFVETAVRAQVFSGGTIILTGKRTEYYLQTHGSTVIFRKVLSYGIICALVFNHFIFNPIIISPKNIEYKCQSIEFIFPMIEFIFPMIEFLFSMIAFLFSMIAF